MHIPLPRTSHARQAWMERTKERLQADDLFAQDEENVVQGTGDHGSEIRPTARESSEAHRHERKSSNSERER